MGNYTLWCLNRVARWDLGELKGKLAEPEGWSTSTPHSVRLGNRAAFDRGPDGAANDEPAAGDGILMHEEAACDEYFVPIAVKCIGDPRAFADRFGHAFTTRGRELFRDVLDRYAAYFRDEAWKAYWHPFPMGSPLFHMGMFTRTDGPRPYAGLYEIVADDAAQTERKAVLVGYSQGGLVARFLAWMDEQFMAPSRRCISGVLTVQSPNYGSPLASLCNAPNIAVAFLGILTALGGFPVAGAQSPVTRAALAALVAGTLSGTVQSSQGAELQAMATARRMPRREGPREREQLDRPPPAERWHFDIGAVCRVLEAMLEEPTAQDGKGEVFRTARKWLTGVAPLDVATAFDDLDPRHLDDERTVLGRLVTSPLREVWHGAVIGRDTQLEDLALSFLPWVLRRLARPLIDRWLEPIETSYARIAMNEGDNAVPKGTRHERLARLYADGTEIPGADGDLPAFAHDFVIPSVSQGLYTLGEEGVPDVFLGNVVNPKATHLSGGVELGCDSDRRYVFRMLRELGRRLH